MRKTGSNIDKLVNFINRQELGDTYTCAEARTGTGIDSEQLGDVHMNILSTKCISRVKRGTYQVISHIPDFVDTSVCEANRGYRHLHKKWKLGDAITSGVTSPAIELKEPLIEKLREATTTKEIKEVIDEVSYEKSLNELNNYIPDNTGVTLHDVQAIKTIYQLVMTGYGNFALSKRNVSKNYITNPNLLTFDTISDAINFAQLLSGDTCNNIVNNLLKRYTTPPKVEIEAQPMHEQLDIIESAIFDKANETYVKSIKEQSISTIEELILVLSRCNEDEYYDVLNKKTQYKLFMGLEGVSITDKVRNLTKLIKENSKANVYVPKVQEESSDILIGSTHPHNFWPNSPKFQAGSIDEVEDIKKEHIKESIEKVQASDIILSRVNGAPVDISKEELEKNIVKRIISEASDNIPSIEKPISTVDIMQALIGKEVFVICSDGAPRKCKIKGIELEIDNDNSIIIDNSTTPLSECNIFNTKEELLREISNSLD